MINCLKIEGIRFLMYFNGFWIFFNYFFIYFFVSFSGGGCFCKFDVIYVVVFFCVFVFDNLDIFDVFKLFECSFYVVWCVFFIIDYKYMRKRWVVDIYMIRNRVCFYVLLIVFSYFWIIECSLVMWSVLWEMNSFLFFFCFSFNEKFFLIGRGG